MGKIILAHISDLHFDSAILNQSFAGIPHRLGHDKTLAFALMTALEDLPSDRQTEELVNLVVTGDLTREGDESEFAVAHTLLRSTARLTHVSPPDLMGYGFPQDRFTSVPGNHDQYGAGGPMPAFNPYLSGRHFEGTPWHRRITDSHDEVTLDLFGIDTNTGRIPLPPGWNVPAWGAISNQEFTDLENLLNANPPIRGRTVRALAMHHSLSYTGGGVGALIWCSAILPSSRRKLRKICADHEIAAVLSGHTHTIFYDPPIAAKSSQGSSHNFRELRSPSTLAIKQKMNGFLVHEIYNEPGRRVRWDTYSYTWKSPWFVGDPQKATTLVV